MMSLLSLIATWALKASVPGRGFQGRWLGCALAGLLLSVAAVRGADLATVPAGTAAPLEDRERDYLLELEKRAAGANGAKAETKTGPVEPNEAETLALNQRLMPGDRVSFRIVEDKGEAKIIPVADSGEIEVPYIGRVMARGRTCAEMVPEIKRALEETYYFQATVLLGVDYLNPARGMVYLFGEVRGAGPQPIPSDETLTLSKAVIRAGGFTDFANQKRVRVTRQAREPGRTNEVFTVDAERVMKKGELEKDLALERGDIIYVPTRAINF